MKVREVLVRKSEDGSPSEFDLDGWTLWEVVDFNAINWKLILVQDDR